MDELPFGDSDLELAHAAIEDATSADVAFCKFLTANDTGETQSHQAGLHISKHAWPLIFDVPGVKGSNMDRLWEVCWNGGSVTQSRAIYYGQGTRNEYRMTRLGPEFRGPEHTGDLLVVTRRLGSERLNAWVLEDEGSVEEFLGAFALSPENTNQVLDVRRSRPRASALPGPTPEDRARLIAEFVEGLPEGVFPSTEEVSAAARAIDLRLRPSMDPAREPDVAIKRWAELEYVIFRALEEGVHGDHVAAGFESVEEFVGLANTILNRRKSRAGHSLENHLAAIFTAAAIPFTAQPRTEGRRKPDFIFPSESQYHDDEWPDSRLVFLAAKTTCKDRWRQILNEADRIPHKHLFTLQQGISGAQLDEMASAGVTLVVPADNKSTFPKAHRDWILTLKEFLDLAAEVTTVP